MNQGFRWLAGDADEVYTEKRRSTLLYLVTIMSLIVAMIVTTSPRALADSPQRSDDDRVVAFKPQNDEAEEELAARDNDDDDDSSNGDDSTGDGSSGGEDSSGGKDSSNDGGSDNDNDDCTDDADDSSGGNDSSDDGGSSDNGGGGSSSGGNDSSGDGGSDDDSKDGNSSNDSSGGGGGDDDSSGGGDDDSSGNGGDSGGGNCGAVINLQKSGPATAVRGQTITYTFRVSIPGNIPLTNISVTDPRCNTAPALSTKTGGDQDAILEQNEVWTYTCPHLVTQSDPDPLPNVATAKGTGPQGQPVQDTDDHTVDLQSAAININKTGPNSGVVGQSANYTLTVTLGNSVVPLSNVTVTDNKCNSAPLLQSMTGGDQDSTLEQGEVWTYTCSRTILAGDAPTLVNVATATGTPPTGSNVSDTDDHQLTVVPAGSAQIDIVKTGPSTAQVGQTVTYTLSVSIPNNRSVPLSNVVVTDNKCSSAPSLSSSTGDQDAILEQGEVWIYTCTRVIQAGDAPTLVNIASATGTPPQGSNVSDTDDHTLSVPAPNAPTIHINKTGPSSGQVGQDVTYTLAVSIPSGSIPLTNVTVTDNKCDSAPVLQSSTGDQDAVLEPGEVWTYTCKRELRSTDAPSVLNVASVTGTPPSGSNVTDTDDHTVTVSPATNAQINVKKSGPQEANVGDKVTYTLEVSVPGAEPLTNITVSDPLCDSAPQLKNRQGDSDAILETGEVWTYTCQRTVRPSDPKNFVNIATVEGTTTSNTTVDDEDDHTVDIVPAANIVIRKTGPQSAAVGDTVTYTIKVTNPVDNPLHDIRVSDPRCDNSPNLQSKSGGDQDSLLEKGETWTYTCKHKVTAGDPTPLRNTATVTGEDDSGNEVTDRDTHTLEIVEGGDVIVCRTGNCPLPFTGMDASNWTLWGLLSMLTGGAFMWFSRRRMLS